MVTIEIAFKNDFVAQVSLQLLFNAISMFLVVFEVAFVDVARVFACKLTLPMHLVILPVSLILKAGLC